VRRVKYPLPTTGSPELLRCVSPYIPDDFINEQWPLAPTGGRRRNFSAAQLWRTHLLTLLTPAHAINWVLELLPSEPAWRQFAHLRHRTSVPDVRMMHEFRVRMGVTGLRRINVRLLEPLLASVFARQDTIALIDATDLPASCSGFKKRVRVPTRHNEPPWAAGHSRLVRAVGLSVTRSIPFVCGYRITALRCY
jgi:hypothetical protein